jgi:hypothetical protein
MPKPNANPPHFSASTPQFFKTFRWTIPAPPFQIISPGKTFRKDSDATHSPMFHQFEGLLIDENVSIANLKWILQTALSALFRKEIELRFRLSYFPFTEPSLEVDASCVLCGGENSKCKMCKGTGFLELGGAGIVHRNVLKNCGVDAKRILPAPQIFANSKTAKKLSVEFRKAGRIFSPKNIGAELVPARCKIASNFSPHFFKSEISAASPRTNLIFGFCKFVSSPKNKLSIATISFSSGI